MGAGPRTNTKIYFEDAIFTFAGGSDAAALGRRDTETMLIAGAVKDISAVVYETDGSLFAGATFAVVRLEQDGNPDDGFYWNETTVDWEAALTVNQVATLLEGAEHSYQLPAVATSGRVGATVHFTFKDDIADASATTVCTGGEHRVRDILFAAADRTSLAEILLDTGTTLPAEHVAIAAAVWDELRAGHTTANSFAVAVRRILSHLAGDSNLDPVTGRLTVSEVDVPANTEDTYDLTDENDVVSVTRVLKKVHT